VRPAPCSENQVNPELCKFFQDLLTSIRGLPLAAGKYKKLKSIPERCKNDWTEHSRVQTHGYGKVEFCLTKLQVLRATSSTFAPPHWIDVLNAFGLFASARRDRR
jgi:hypothetical protein